MYKRKKDYGWTDERMKERKKMDRRKDRKDGWKEERKDGWMDG